MNNNIVDIEAMDAFATQQCNQPLISAEQLNRIYPLQDGYVWCDAHHLSVIIEAVGERRCVLDIDGNIRTPNIRGVPVHICRALCDVWELHKATQDIAARNGE